nr:unnamed protein product [Callosobruchus chinensis]
MKFQCILNRINRNLIFIQHKSVIFVKVPLMRKKGQFREQLIKITRYLSYFTIYQFRRTFYISDEIRAIDILSIRKYISFTKIHFRFMASSLDKLVSYLDNSEKLITKSFIKTMKSSLCYQRKKGLYEAYNLECLKYYTAPGLAYASALKCLGLQLELLDDV